MSKSNPLITVGKLTFTVDEVEELLMHALDMDQNVPMHYNSGAAMRDLRKIVSRIKERNNLVGSAI